MRSAAYAGSLYEVSDRERYGIIQRRPLAWIPESRVMVTHAVNGPEAIPCKSVRF